MSFLFQPTTPKKPLYWPFLLNKVLQPVNKYTYTSLLCDIAPTPSVSRYKQFTINILARLYQDWAILYHKLINLCLICCIIPTPTKITAQVPIPKPNSVGHQPISVIHAVEAHLSTIVTTHLDTGLEQAGPLPAYVFAYCKNKSCVDITISHAAAIEDFQQHQHTILAQLDGDFEKYFDHITLGMQRASLLRHGCQPHDYTEFISDCFQNNMVEIITDLGCLFTTFPCGVKQGSALSCILGNLSTHMNTEAWNIPLPQNLHMSTAHDPKAPYLFSPTSHHTTPPLQITSYCDAGSCFLRCLDTNNLHSYIQHYVHTTAAFSVVTRIGHNAAKSKIRIYICPTNYKPSPITSTVWSFKHLDIITKELQILTSNFNPSPSSPPPLHYISTQPLASSSTSSQESFLACLQKNCLNTNFLPVSSRK